MSVMQRKLFANKEARTKLRDMGGIMSSFPELSGEVQRFQAGGGVNGSGMTPDEINEIHRIMLEKRKRQAEEEFERYLPRPDSGMTPDEINEIHQSMFEERKRQADEEFRRDFLSFDNIEDIMPPAVGPGQTGGPFLSFDDIKDIMPPAVGPDVDPDRRWPNLDYLDRYGPGQIEVVSPRSEEADQTVAGSGQTVADPDVDPFITYEQWKEMSTAERKRLGLPTTWLGGQDYFNRVGVLLGVNDPETGEPLNPEPLPRETPEFREVDPNATAFMQDVQRLLRQGKIAGALRRIQTGLKLGNYGPAGSSAGRMFGYFSDDPETAAQRAANREAAQWFDDPANKQFLLENPDLILQAAEDPIGFVARARSGELTTPPTTPPEQGVAGVTSAEDSLGDQEGAEEEPGQTGGPDDVEDIMPPPPGGGEDGKGEDDPDILRSRAEKRIELFQDLFGSDKPTARDKAMQFAMIGLAIAAGQSPNALTNIASGLLAGTEAMSEQEEGRRKTKRDLQQIAVESVLEEMQAEREEAKTKYQPTESYPDRLASILTSLINQDEPFATANKIAQELINPLYNLPTPTQIVLQLQREGRSNAEIAAFLREAGLDPKDFGLTDG